MQVLKTTTKLQIQVSEALLGKKKTQTSISCMEGNMSSGQSGTDGSGLKQKKDEQQQMQILRQYFTLHGDWVECQK